MTDPAERTIRELREIERWQDRLYGVAAVERWRKSTKSNPSGNCFEVAEDETLVFVRDSKNRDQGYLTFAQAAWAAFVDDIKDGLDRPKT